MRLFQPNFNWQEFYFVPDGRVSKDEYLYRFFLPLMIILFLILFVPNFDILFFAFSPIIFYVIVIRNMKYIVSLNDYLPMMYLWLLIPVINFLYVFFVVRIKRLHDIGCSGWFQFGIMSLIFFASLLLSTDEDSNTFETSFLTMLAIFELYILATPGMNKPNRFDKINLYKD